VYELGLVNNIKRLNIDLELVFHRGTIYCWGIQK